MFASLQKGTQRDEPIDKIIGNGKRFMAYEIVARLNQLGREDLVELMKSSVKESSKVRNKRHEVFEPSFDCNEVVRKSSSDRN